MDSTEEHLLPLLIRMGVNGEGTYCNLPPFKDAMTVLLSSHEHPCRLQPSYHIDLEDFDASPSETL